MSEQRKVVIKETPEAVANLEFDENITVGLTEDPEAKDILVEETLAEFNNPDIDMAEEDYKAVEDLDDEEEIWEGGPTAGMIKQWKEQYGEVYVTSISYDKHIVWRVLNRIEYKQIVKKMEQLVQAGQMSQAEANMWNEETISEMCMLFPQYNRQTAAGVMAGLPSLISQEVLEASGFVALEVRQL